MQFHKLEDNSYNLIVSKIVGGNYNFIYIISIHLSELNPW